MEKVNIYPYLYIYTKILSAMSQKEINNLTSFIDSITDNYGIVCQRLAEGQLASDLHLEVVPPANLMIGGGKIIIEIDGEIRLVNVSNHSYTGSSFSLGLNYIFVVPRKRTTEPGLLTFTPGSKTVTISGGTFNKLNPYETLSTSLGNFKVSNEISETSLELVEEYSGAFRDDIEFTILGYYGEDQINTSALYEYDDYDIVISRSDTYTNGIRLGSVTKEGSGFLTVTSDDREESLYKIKGIHQINADAISTGVLNAITTLDEKYNALSQSLFVKDFFTKGVRNGFASSLNQVIGDYELIVTAGTAYGGNGRRITSSQSITTLLEANTQIGINYVYIKYLSYGSAEIAILPSQSSDDDYVLICRVIKDAGSIPPYTLFDTRSYTKFKVSGILSEGRSEGWAEGDLYYKAISNGNGKFLYRRMKLDGTGLEEIELMNYPRVLTEIQDAIDAIAKKERLRFALYPESSDQKSGWFLHQGIACPALVGYQFQVNKTTTGICPLSAINPATQVVSDIPSHVSSLIVDKNAVYSSIEVKTYEGNAYNDKSFVGVYYNHTSGKAELIINGAVVEDEINIGALSSDQVVLVEVEIQTLEGLIAVPEQPGVE